jgi:hypothetical protein
MMVGPLMHWPATFGAERIELIENLSRLTGHSERDLSRALRGMPLHEISGMAHGLSQPRVREELEQRVREARR